MSVPAQSAFTSSLTITRPANTTAYAALDVIGVDAGTAQVETATASGTITAGTLQVETATVVATVSAGGNAAVVVTGAALENSPITFAVAVATSDDASAVAGKIRTALAANENIDDAYTVSGATDAVILTAKVKAANDTSLNIAVSTGTATGITTAASSANTTAGVAIGTGNATVTVTGAGITGSPLAVSVPVVAGDTAAAWALKVTTALQALSAITSLYTVTNSTADIIFTRTIPAANDATLNIALTNGTCTGITPAASSADTTAGSISTTGAGSAIHALTNMGPKGGFIYITDINLRVHVTSVPSGMTTFRVFFYDASPDAILDNAAFDLVSAGDRGKYLGYVDLVTPTDVGSTILSENSQINKRVKLAADSSTLYAQVQTIGGYTPSSGAVKVLEVKTLAIL